MNAQSSGGHGRLLKSRILDPRAGAPPDSDESGFDVGSWRSDAVERFGPEETYGDGSQEDYVKSAYILCAEEHVTWEERIADMGAEFEGSFEHHVHDTFCPNIEGG